MLALTGILLWKEPEGREFGRPSVQTLSSHWNTQPLYLCSDILYICITSLRTIRLSCVCADTTSTTSSAKKPSSVPRRVCFTFQSGEWFGKRKPLEESSNTCESPFRRLSLQPGAHISTASLRLPLSPPYEVILALSATDEQDIWSETMIWGTEKVIHIIFILLYPVE